MQSSRKEWAMKLDDALWAYTTAFKTPTGLSPYMMFYGKACYLLVELKHRSYWATRFLNFNKKDAGDKRLLQLNELEEWRNNAYENQRIYKEKLKNWQDKFSNKKNFQ